MKPVRCVLAFLPLVLLSSACLAQRSSFKGRVEADGKPLTGATIYCGKAHAMTDSSGFFEVQTEIGKRALVVTMTGFEPFREMVDIPSDKLVVVSLKPSVASLGEVVVTGTSKPVQRLQSPIAVEVYSPHFFKKNPTPSLFEAMQNVNGVRPQINCSVCNSGDIHINGLEGPYTMVTVDGMPIVSSLGTVYGLFGIPNTLIERVEIVKGPASGLYGSEAIGGLINIITKDADKAPRFTANLMSTSWQEHSGDFGFRTRLGRRVSSLTGVHFFNYSNPIDKNGDQFTDVTLQKRISVFQKLGFQRRQDRIASLAARYLYEDRWGGQMHWNKSFRGSDSVYGESIYTKRWELLGKYQLPVGDPVFFDVSATHHDQNSWYGNTPYMGRQGILFGQLRWERRLGARHAMVAGLATRYTYYDDNSTATIDTLMQQNRPEKVWLPGVFLQDEWKLSEKHLVLLGARWDYHPVHKHIFTPRLAYKWNIRDDQTLRVNAGTGFRVVNLFTEDHAALTGARAVEITEALKPEQSYNVNINYLRRLGKGSLQWTVDASVWYTYFYNQIIADYDIDPQKIIYDNLKGYAESKGATLNVELNWRQRLKGMFGLTLQDVALVETGVDGKKQRQQQPFTERWSGTWSLSYSFPVSGWTIDYTGNVYGPMRLPLASEWDPRSPESPVWSIQNIQFTKWMSKELELFGGVKNLLNWTPARNNPFLIARSHDPFDRQLDYNGDGQVDLDANGKVPVTAVNPYGLTFDPTYIYAPNQGIRFFLGLRYNIR